MQAADMEEIVEEPMAQVEAVEEVAAEPTQAGAVEEAAAEPMQAETAEEAVTEPVVAQAETAKETVEEPVQAGAIEQAVAEPVQAETVEKAAVKLAQKDTAEEVSAESAQPSRFDALIAKAEELVREGKYNYAARIAEACLELAPPSQRKRADIMLLECLVLSNKIEQARKKWLEVLNKMYILEPNDKLKLKEILQKLNFSQKQVS
jgi:hypothetical protein